MEELKATMQQMSQNVVHGVVAAFENAVDDGGGISRRSLNEAIAASIDATGIRELISRLDAQSKELTDREERTAHDESEDAASFAPYTWGGEFRRAPENFQFLDGGPRQLWVQWMYGVETSRVCPYRHLKPSDLSNKNTRKRLCDVRFLMSRLETACTNSGMHIARCTTAEACKMFDAVEAAIALPATTGRNRERRQVS